jgi:citrate lyase beta subunit
MPYRALIFVPGHRESMLDKACTMSVDAVVFDLEDSVPPSEKHVARQRVGRILRELEGTEGPRQFVRISHPSLGMLAEDTVVVRNTGAGVVVPKVDRPLELEDVFDALGSREHELIVNIETPRSLLHAEAFADLNGVDGLFLGGEDFTNLIGSRRTPEGDELSWARHMVLLAARAGGVAAYDTICPEFRDLAVLERDCRRAAEMGFDGKFAIHPAQIDIIQRAFTPPQEEVERARRIVEAFDGAMARGEGAVAVDGQMVDPPVAERARALLSRVS